MRFFFLSASLRQALASAKNGFQNQEGDRVIMQRDGER
jgi:hypothetical protein